MKVYKTVHDTWIISETTRLFGLTLTETGRITAPEGKLVTMGLQWREYSAIAGTV